MAETKIIDGRITHFISQMMSDPILGTDDKIISTCIPSPGQYVTYVTVNDWGESVNKLVFNPETPLSKSQLIMEDFQIFTTHSKLGNKSESTGNEISERKITDIYFCDGKGNKTEDESRYIAVELYSEPGNPEHGLFEKIAKTVGRSCFFLFVIYNEKINLEITRRAATVHTLGGKFVSGEFKYSASEKSTNEVDVRLQSLFYKPETRNKMPLIVWLHGISEGGVNPYLPLMKIPAVNLADKKLQGYFENGAAILIPQCPVSWLQTTDKDALGLNLWAPIPKIANSAMRATADIVSGFLDPSKKQEAKVSAGKAIGDAATDLFGGLFKKKSADMAQRIEDTSHFANVSMYTSSLKALIDRTISENPEIDTNRIYIGGCSAGGYMTLNMILQYPDFFAAAFPVCAAYPDSKISSSDIDILSNIPLWFSYSAYDQIVKPATHSLATFNRLMEAGARKAHICEFSRIIDLTGEYTDENGQPHEYAGHESWIYVLNDLSEEDGVKLFDWLSKQSK